MSRFWLRWLTLVALAVIVFGLSMFLLPSLSQGFFNLLIFQHIASPFAAAPERYIVFICGIYGVTIVCWMLALLTIIVIPFRRGELWAWWAITLSLGVWFVVDSTYSLAVGFSANAALNATIFVMFAIPLTATYKEFGHSSVRVDTFLSAK